MGNLRSVAKALEAASCSVVVTAETHEIARADAMCVPGQGIYGKCMKKVRGNGFDNVIRDWVGDGRPYLGICLGMQILFDSSVEDPDIPGLGIVAGEVTKLPSTVRVPHIGWNTAARSDGTATYFYFDHSYAAHPADPGVVSLWCEHGEPFAAAIQAGSILGVQFHPEKSGRSGIHLLSTWSRQ